MAKLYGYEEPRIFTPPLRELTPDTTLGFEVVAFAEQVLGMTLLPWQKWLFVHALEVIDNQDGSWMLRFRTVLVLIGRQNGKTTMGAVLSLFFLYALRTGLIIGTAQDLEQAEDTWSLCVDMAQGDPELKEQIAHVWYTNGSKRLQLTGGRDYRVKASTRKAGRGKSADLVLLDELREHQSFEAYAALSKTGIAKASALLWCMSNAGDGTSVVLRHLRTRAHAMIGDPDGVAKSQSEAPAPDGLSDTALAIFEWSADPSLPITSTEAWRQANPSLGYTITERAIRSACADDPEDVFKTECLCQWITAAVTPPFPVGAWEKGTDADSQIAPDSPLWWGVDVSDDRGKTSIAVCGRRADRKWHAELVEYRPGVGWLQQWFAERAPKYRGMRVALQSKGAPVSAMADIIGAVDGVEIVPCQGADVAGWCGRLWDAVAACDEESDSDSVPILHRPQPALDLAANVASTKPMGDGAWAWDRRKSMEDISPLVAVTMAHGAATSVSKEKRSAYEDGADLIVL